MTAASMEATDVGCYDLRGPDFETLLIGPITGSIIDAARLVRLDWGNGFPNWAMYRTAYAGDSHLAEGLRAWCEAFGAAYVLSGGVRNGSSTLGHLAGRDAYYALCTTRWAAPADELAAALGVSPRIYRRTRAAILARLMVSLQEYWMRLNIAMRQVALVERKQQSTAPMARLSEGRGHAGDLDIVGDGNFRARPRGSGC